MRDRPDEQFGEFDLALRGTGHHVAAGALLGGGALDGGVSVAEDDRTVLAHQVDVFVAVDVPQSAVAGAGEVLGVA